MNPRISRSLFVCVPLLTAMPASFAQYGTRPALPSAQFSNRIAFDASQNRFDFIYEGADGNLKYEYRPASGGSFMALQCVVDDAYKFRPSNFGGPGLSAGGGDVLPWSSGVAYRMAGSQIDADTLTVRWRMTFGQDTLRYAYRFHILGRTLVLSVTAETAQSQAVFLDRCENAVSPITVHVPYLPLMNLLYTNGVFASMFFDWEKTRASGLYPVSGTFSPTSVYFAQTAEYLPKTDGSRLPLNETIYLTVSPSIHDVLPCVPNPVSPLRSASADRIVFDLWNEPFASSRQYIERLRQAGLKNLWVINHVWQRAGYDNQYPDVLPANPDYGGDAGLRAMSQAAAKAGYLFALHENYIDFYPDTPSWNPEFISLNSDGSMKKAWFNPETEMQSFQTKPSLAAYFLGLFAPRIHSDFSTTASFLDVHSSISPSAAVDYDASAPGAGAFRETLGYYRGLAADLRRIHGGPVSGEGNHHFLHAGYFDDVEAQINAGGYEARSTGQWLPLLMDFELLKLHGLMTPHGVGYYERFFCDEANGSVYSAFPLDKTLEYIAAELAYGHGGFIPNPDRSRDFIRAALLEQRHVFSTQKLVAAVNAVRISYNDRGEEVDASEYIRRHPSGFADRNHADFMGQVRVEYDNGTIVCVNRHPAREWRAGAGGGSGWLDFHAVISGRDSLWTGMSERTDFLLPAKSGWVVYSPAPPPGIDPDTGVPLADRFSLSPNYPNPFNAGTTISFTLAETVPVRIDVFNAAGRKISSLVDHILPSGNHRTTWNATGSASGVYLVRLKAGSFEETRKMVLLR
jgi:hypothetical protein